MNSITLAYSVISLYILAFSVLHYSKNVDFNEENFQWDALQHPNLFMLSSILLCVNIVWTFSNAIYIIIIW